MSFLTKLNACGSGRDWADSQESYKRAWDKCTRGDWMLWIAKKQNVGLRKLTGAKAGCAGLVRHLMPEESKRALDVAIAFAMGEATRNQLDTAAAAAYAAAYDDDAAAYAASAAADADADADARIDTLSKSADIVRQWISFKDLNINEDSAEERGE